MQERRRRKVRNIPEPTDFQGLMEKYGPVEGYFKYSDIVRGQPQTQSASDAYFERLIEVMAELVRQGMSEDTAVAILDQTEAQLSGDLTFEQLEELDLPYFNQINSLTYPQYIEDLRAKTTKYEESQAKAEETAKKEAYEKEIGWNQYRSQVASYLNTRGMDKNKILNQAREMFDVGVKASDLPYYNESKEYQKQIQEPEYLEEIQDYQNRETRWIPPENVDLPGISYATRTAAQRFRREQAVRVANLQRPQDWIKRWEAENTIFATNVDQFLEKERLQERMAWVKNEIDKYAYGLAQSVGVPESAADVEMYRTNLDPLTSEYSRLKAMESAIPGGSLISGQVKPTGTPQTPRWLAAITDTKAGSMIQKGRITPPPTLASLKSLTPTQRGMYEGYANWAAGNPYAYGLLEEEAYRRTPYSPGFNKVRWSAVRQ